jgi:membrane dipeptidase
VAAPTDLFIWDDHLGFDARIDADLDRLERWRTAGASFLSINVGYDVMPWHDAIRVLAAYRAWIEAH